MKIAVSFSRILRLASLVVMTVTLASTLPLASDMQGFLYALGCCLFAGNAMLLYLPLHGEEVRASLIASALSAALLLALNLLCRDLRQLAQLTAVSCFAAVSIYYFYRTIRKFSHVRLLNTADSLLRDTRDQARTSILLLLSLLVTAFLFADYNGGSILALVLFCAAGAALLVLQYKRAFTGRICLISGEAEKVLYDVGVLRTTPLPPTGTGELTRMNDVYRRAVEYMEVRKPYLNPGLTIEKVARDLGVNRSYLSRVINAYSEKNFCQFVGTYRVNYAVKELDKNPKLKMMEVAMVSGFRTVVSFNMVFKMNMNCTPTEYVSRITV